MASSSVHQILMDSRKQMKIAYIMKTYPKISETFILREILALESEGLDLHLFALDRPQEQKSHASTLEVKAKVRYIPSSFAATPLVLLWASLFLLVAHPRRFFYALRFVAGRQEPGGVQDLLRACYVAWIIRRLGITHLHAHFINKPATIAELVHLLIGIPFSITAHAKDIYLSPAVELSRKMETAKFVVTCTEYNRNFLQNLSLHTPVVRIYHGLDLRQFQPSAQTKSIEEPPIVLAVGRLREKKGFLCLVDACRLLKVGGYRFHCVIAGYGPLKHEIERRISRFGLSDTVSLTGMLTQDEVIALYLRATMFVLPCQITDDGDRDGIPNVLAEAMAMGLPVISTKVSGIPELVEPMKNGILVRPEDPVGLAASITRLLEQSLLRQELGAAGRRKVCEQFSSKRNALQLKALFSTFPVLTREDPHEKPPVKTRIKAA